MNFTPHQLRAARGLLDISQEELRLKTGLAKSQISDFENGKTDFSFKNREIINAYFNGRGIEFTDFEGVRRKPESPVSVFEGISGFRAFMEDVYETTKEFGGDICLFNSKPRLWHELLGEDWYSMHADRIAALGDKVKVRIIVPEGESFFILPTAEHRWFPQGAYKGRIFYAYGPKLAFLNFADQNINILVFNQTEYADMFRMLFDVAWEERAVSPPGRVGK